MKWKEKKRKKNCLPTSPKSFLPSHEVGEANLFSHPLVGHAITVYILFFKAMGRWNIFFFCLNTDKGSLLLLLFIITIIISLCSHSGGGSDRTRARDLKQPHRTTPNVQGNWILLDKGRFRLKWDGQIWDMGRFVVVRWGHWDIWELEIISHLRRLSSVRGGLKRFSCVSISISISLLSFALGIN